MRFGIGFDVHQLVKGRNLILGGEKIPYGKGLLGHSDADVLLHAIIDAMLGALALGDIGQHFPDTDPQYAGIQSLELLKNTYTLIQKQNYKIGNIDSIIIAQEPKLKPYIPAIRTNIAQALDLDQQLISVKATTTESLGYVGRKEGIASQAVVCLLEN